MAFTDCCWLRELSPRSYLEIGHVSYTVHCKFNDIQQRPVLNMSDRKNSSSKTTVHSLLSATVQMVQKYHYLEKHHRHHLWLHYCFNAAFNASFKYLSLRKLLVPVCCQPNTGQWALLAQHKMCIKHGLETKKNINSKNSRILTFMSYN